jgi:hypothetical protein
MSNHRKDPLSEALRARAAVVISDLDRSGPLHAGEVLAWRDWFDRHRNQLKSSGGRPTNPHWTVKRQVSFAPEVWNLLEARAKVCSDEGQKIAPGQVASFLIEDAVHSNPQVEGTEWGEEEEIEQISNDLRFRDWEMPAPFAGSKA